MNLFSGQSRSDDVNAKQPLQQKQNKRELIQIIKFLKSDISVLYSNTILTNLQDFLSVLRDNHRK